MNRLIIFFCCTLFLFVSASTPVAEEDVTVIAFGSCNKVDKKQKFWPIISQNNPDLWLWLGDIIYADTEDMTEMKAQYDEQLSSKKYIAFRNSVPINGIWDDHDYGDGNAGKEYPKKAESRDLLFEFLGITKDDERWDHEGAYGSQLYDFGGEDRTVNVIFLDCRYFRDEPPCSKPWKKSCSKQLGGTMLGEEQWAWLEEELKSSKAALTVICSGVQFLPDRHPYEKWANFPSEKYKLWGLIEKYQPKKTILLSGDRHFSEISRIIPRDNVKDAPASLENYLYEFTSSGLTHTYEDAKEKNKLRVGELTSKKNFGLLKINWDKRSIIMEARGRDNQVLISHTVAF